MIFAFLYLIIGSAVSYFMQSHIVWFAEYMHRDKKAQIAFKIFLDAVLGVTWIVSAPLLIIVKLYITLIKNEGDSND